MRHAKMFGAGTSIVSLVLGAVGITPAAAAAAAGASSIPLVSVAAAASVTAPPALRYTPVTPLRICDTRAVAANVMANPCNPGPGSGTLGVGLINVMVAGAKGVPATAVSVVLNVTATNTTADSHLTVWPAGELRPLGSNLNWVAGRTVPNLVDVPVGANGSVSVYNNAGATDVVIDLQGYVDTTAADLFNPLPPSRICDTRATRHDVALNQCEAAGGAAGTLGAGQIPVTVGGLGGVPTTATAVVLNVTVTGTTGQSYLTVWPDGAAKPLVSNLNWIPGQTVPNRVMVPLSTGGKIDVFNFAGATDVIIDVNGYYSPAAGGDEYLPNISTRLCDTRPASAPNFCNNPTAGGGRPLGPGDELTITPPPRAIATVFNVTVTNTTGSSFLTVFPNATPTARFTTPPLISDLNWVPGLVVANLVVVAAGPANAITFYNNSGSTDLVVDLEGTYNVPPVALAASAVHPMSAAVSIKRRAP